MLSFNTIQIIRNLSQRTSNNMNNIYTLFLNLRFSFEYLIISSSIIFLLNAVMKILKVVKLFIGLKKLQNEVKLRITFENQP